MRWTPSGAISSPNGMKSRRETTCPRLSTKTLGEPNWSVTVHLVVGFCSGGAVEYSAASFPAE
ncbi:MAG: hypothetical protein IPM21_14855 [Acidobacteria bacterium]|nr:hypothetical protein [Acidobacteriota bacterium]